MKSQLLLFYTCLALSATRLASADPPKLVSTSPRFWEKNINATGQNTISVSFDQPMRPGFFDWFGRDVLSPSSKSDTALSKNGLTFTLAVKLQPGRVYIMGLNEKGISGVGFQNEKGVSLPPTYLVFQTAGIPPADDTPPRVLSSSPPNGMLSLDSTKAQSVAITFDQPMNPKKHGLHLYENGQPIDISHFPFTYSADGMTFALPYNFKRASTYRLELNNTQDIGFVRTTRVPLWPATISFATR